MNFSRTAEALSDMSVLTPRPGMNAWPTNEQARRGGPGGAGVGGTSSGRCATPRVFGSEGAAAAGGPTFERTAPCHCLAVPPQGSAALRRARAGEGRAEFCIGGLHLHSIIWTTAARRARAILLKSHPHRPRTVGRPARSCHRLGRFGPRRCEVPAISDVPCAPGPTSRSEPREVGGTAQLQKEEKTGPRAVTADDRLKIALSCGRTARQ